ncbi:Hypothetical protein D9617_1g082350 [Elsinoe fawcettii]|nr:Hypothetical protein D9617_1g082350 [Elsinoe fawcettii]
MSFSIQPLSEPFEPPGIKDRGGTILTVTWSVTSLGVLVLVVRCIYAGTSKGQLRWDCFWAAVAVVIGFVAQVFLTLGCIDGIGQHIWNLGGFAQAGFAIRWFWISALICIWAIAFAKTAIVSLLLSIWCPWQTKRRFFLHFIWSSNILITAIQTALSLRQCYPQEAIWNYASIDTADCSLRPVALNWGYFFGAWSGATDVVLALYSILIMRDIKADLRTKIGFCALMGGGFISAIASALRTYYLYKLTLNFDTTYDMAATTICGSTELWLICILSSIPPLKPLFLRIIGRKSASVFAPTIPSADTGRTAERSEKSITPESQRIGLNLPPTADSYADGDPSRDREHKQAKRKDWLGGITMRNSLRVTSRPATRANTRPGTSNGIV